MKDAIKKVISIRNNTSMRRQIMFAVIVCMLILIVTVAFITNLVNATMENIGNAYQSNVDLDLYQKELAEAQSAMESYMQYGTFESIDRYYSHESTAQTESEKFNANTSFKPILQKRYIIKKLSDSFFYYSDKAIDARRASARSAADSLFSEANKCFAYLNTEILNLNMLLFQTNATHYAESKKQTEYLIRYTVILIITIFISALLLLYIQITKITKPLADISLVAHKLAERDFNVPLFNDKNQNEIGNICRAFDSMIISIREYIDTIWEKAMKENELREKEMEMRTLYIDAHLKALQDQVKPHFLFNTLNTGAQLAMIEGADKTCYFLEQVADFLRYNIQHPGQDASIREELGMLDNYVYIMQVRFGNRYTFQKEVDDEVLETRIPNMILQPLVENCLTHGLHDVIEGGKVSIKIGRSNNMKFISISDNGIGFDEVLRKQILAAASGDAVVVKKNEEVEPSEQHISTGLINVISRLKLYFKNDDVFDILKNEDGKGTVFYIKIPNV